MMAQWDNHRAINFLLPLKWAYPFSPSNSMAGKVRCPVKSTQIIFEISPYLYHTYIMRGAKYK